MTKGGEEKPDLVIDQDQQYKITLKIEGKADWTAKVYKFICPKFRLDKTSLHQLFQPLIKTKKFCQVEVLIGKKFVNLSHPISLAFNFK